MNRAPRITLSANDISGIFPVWAELCDRLIVYQHDKDAKVSSTHCHVLFIGVKVGDEALKRRFKKMYPDLKTPAGDSNGNLFWKWESEKPPDEGYITYMAKGKLRPVFVKNIPDTLIEEYRSKWIERAQVHSPGTSSDKKEKYAEFDEALQFVEKKYTETSYINLDGIRTTTMRYYWQRDGRVPPPTAYKRVAATVFLKMVEKREYLPDAKPFSVAMEEIINLWY